jgi:hypothetical protein
MKGVGIGKRKKGKKEKRKKEKRKKEKGKNHTSPGRCGKLLHYANN